MRRATHLHTKVYASCDISIHALHEESDPATGGGQYTVKFQSTLSMRRATVLRQSSKSCDCISIHALHEESDPSADLIIRET